MTLVKKIESAGKPAQRKFSLTTFRRDEGGSMIVFTLFLFVLIMIVGGMAVDFMRFESRRAMMQGALDGAVLAAADLDQELTPGDVVEDHLTKSQVGNCLTAPASVSTPSANYRKVEASCELVLDTFFLGYVGMDFLYAKASSVAIEGVGEIEVSLVVDISGSMENNISSLGTTRIQELRSAATAFVDALLKPEYEDKISLSLIPYSEDVNIGPDLYGTLTTAPYAVKDDATADSSHDYSHCVILPDTAFSTTTWSNSVSYRQVPHFQWNPTFTSDGSALTAEITEPVCPHNSYERIIPLSQDKVELNNAISQLQPRAGTSIFLGLKWAVNLLDPSFQTNIAALPEGVIDDAFEGRPSAYGTTDNPSSTIKYIVLMTDGQNDNSNRIHEDHYDDSNDVAHWANFNWWYFYNYRAGGSYNKPISYFVQEQFYTAATGDTHMQNMCSAAKEQGIIIFGIAMDSTANGQTQMSNCASSSGHYYETSGDELTEIFEAIAEQITDLRLTQ